MPPCPRLGNPIVHYHLVLVTFRKQEAAGEVTVHSGISPAASEKSSGFFIGKF